MLDVELFGATLAPDAPQQREVEELCTLVARRLGLEQGHVAVEYVTRERIAELNVRHRAKAGPTDVLSFPIDGLGPLGDGAAQEHRRELGDVIICPEETVDMHEAIVHGMLHLLGMDHERDDGEMLALQAQLLSQAGR
jgi:probable rRNA maturation factor